MGSALKSVDGACELDQMVMDLPAVSPDLTTIAPANENRWRLIARSASNSGDRADAPGA